jgi:mutual gliding-motility protein MglA
MALVDIEGKKISAKIVYVGPTMSGKTTNLIGLYNLLPTEFRSELAVIGDADERTVFFDYLPLDLGKVDGYDIQFRVFSVSGQPENPDIRRAILTGADGVVFVADSERGREEANVEAMAELRKHLAALSPGAEAEIPLVVQFNKLDLDQLANRKELMEALGTQDQVVVPASALNNQGVIESLQAICRLVVDRL